MEIGERMAAVESKVQTHDEEIVRLRNSSVEIWRAMAGTDSRLSMLVEKVDGLTGTLHLVAENAASVAIARYRTEVGPSIITWTTTLKLLGAIITLAGLAVGIRLGTA